MTVRSATKIFFSLLILCSLAIRPGVDSGEVVFASESGHEETRDAAGKAGPDHVESAPEILLVNPKSEPTLGGAWDIRAVVRGSAELRVSPVWPTRIRVPGEPVDGADLELRWVKAGEQRIDPKWDGTGWVVPVETSFTDLTVSLRVLTRGPHEVRLGYGGSSQIARNSALATFTSIPTGTSSLGTDGGHSMVIADLNGDGYPDIAKTEDGGGGGDELIVEINDGDGTFTRNSTGSNVYRGIAAGDVDNDGDIDLATVWNSSNRIRVYYNDNGEGDDWDSENLDQTNSEGVIFADINGNGLLDVWSPGQNELWHENEGDGSFDDQNQMPGGGGGQTNNGEGATAADINNDGYLDYLWNRTGTVCQAYINDGDFTYTRHDNVSTSFGLPQNVGEHENMEWAWGDFDNDGAVDVYISGSTNIGLYRNNGAGFFSNVGAARGVTITATTNGATWADFNNDGNLDLVVSKGNGSALYLNSGAPGYTFSQVALLAGITNLNSTVGVFDYDLNGTLDIVTLEGQIWRNDLSGTAATDFLRVRAVGNGGSGWSPRTPIGARIRLYDASNTTLLQTRWVSASQNNFQPDSMVHFGCDPDMEYTLRVLFPTSQREIVISNLVPSKMTTTVGATVLQQTIEVPETTALAAYGYNFEPAEESTPILVWGQNSATTVRFTTFEPDTGVFGSTTTLDNSADQLRWVSMAVAGDGDIFALLTMYNSGGNDTYYRMMRYDGSNWSQDWITPDYDDDLADIRSAEVVAESSSGDLLVVYSDDSDTPLYRTRVGTTWSGPFDVVASAPGGNVEWIRLVPHPSSDEVWLFFSDDDPALFAIRWDGSAWNEGATETEIAGELRENSSNGRVSLSVFDAAFEHATNDLVVAWGRDGGGADTIQYRVKAAASDSFGGVSNVGGFFGGAAGNRRVNEVVLEADPSSDRIALIAMRTFDTENIVGALWNGTGWQDLDVIEDTLNNNDGANARFRSLTAVTWLNGEAVCVYQDNSSNVINWCRWVDGSGWIDESDTALDGGSGELESVFAFTAANRAVFMISMDNNDLYIATFDGSSWTINNSGNAIENNLSTTNEGRPFAAVVEVSGGAAAARDPGLWTGAEDTRWHHPGNWDDWSVPTGGAISIPDGVPNFPVISTDVSLSSLTVETGANLRIAPNGNLTSTFGVTLAAGSEFQMDGGSSLTVGVAGAIQVAATGRFLTRGTDIEPVAGRALITTANPAANSLSIIAAAGAVVDLKGAHLIATRILPAAGAELRLSKVHFETLPTATTNFIELGGVTSGTFNFQNLKFTRGANVSAMNARNIRATAATTPVIVYGYTGNLAGEHLDDDPTNVIRWANNPYGLFISGGTYWQYRRQIRIDHTKVGRGGVQNFPVFVGFTDPAIAGKAMANGNDFRFEADDGTKLAHTIELWNPATGEFGAWVKIPDLSDRRDTLLWLRYGNDGVVDQRDAANTWDSDHVLVWQLEDADGATTVDATGNGRSGTNDLLNQVPGVYGYGAEWVASTGSNRPRVQRTMSAEFPTTEFSYEIWTRLTIGSQDTTVISYAVSGRDNEALLFNGRNLAPYIRQSNAASGINTSNSQWRHLAMTWSNSDGIVRIFVDGVARYANTFNQGSTLNATGGLVLGQDQDSVLGGYAANQAWRGDMDEFRLSRIRRGENWIQTNYNMGLDHTAFAIVSPEESVSPHVLDINDYLPQDGGTLNVRGWLVDSADRLITGHGEYRGTLEIRNPFVGTVHIDGVRFLRGTGVAIDASAATTGTVAVHNSAFIDAGNGATTTVAGTPRAIVVPGGGGIAATFCTIDSSSGAAGFSSATNSVFTSTLTTGGAGTRATHVVDFNNRDLRPTSAMVADAGFGAAVDASWPRDLEGRLRTGTTRRGAWHGVSDSVATVAVSDLTNGLGTGNTVIYGNVPANNTAGNAVYMTGSDGSNCYLSLLSRSSLAVQQSISWAGSRAGFPIFVQCSDDEDQYWVLVPFDSTGDGTLDAIRRIRHNTAGPTLTNVGNLAVTTSAGGAIDFSSNGGWSGQISIQNEYSSGSTGELQLALASPAGNGSIHIWFFNSEVTEGTVWPNADFTGTASRAAESYTSAGTPSFSPNPEAQLLVGGSKGTGSMILTRMVDGTSTASLLRLNRNLTGTVTVLNSYTGGTATGDSIGFTPFQLFKATGQRSIGRTDIPRIATVTNDTLAETGTTLTGHDSYGAVLGVPPVGFYGLGAQFHALYSDTLKLGAVAAVEYFKEQDGDAVLAPLDGSYAFSSNKLQYHGGANPGSFVQGIAPVVGIPTRLAWAPLPATNTVVFCATDAGMLYAWEASGILASTHTNPKGNLLPGFPLRVEGGRVTAANFLSITDATVRARLGLAAGTSNLLALFTDSGQIVLVTVPNVP